MGVLTGTPEICIPDMFLFTPNCVAAIQSPLDSQDQWITPANTVVSHFAC